MTAKERIFKKILTHEFSSENFVKFIKEFLVTPDIIRPDEMVTDFQNSSEFRFHLQGFYHVANFTGNDKSKIAVFAVKLKDYKNIDRARSMQRNFVKTLMESSGVDGAIVAFFADGEAKWRLSFIKLDYEFAGGKVTKKITPAKRYSYLVGTDEPCHTAMERLYPIFINEVSNPNIAEIEKAFSVETVTKQFFEDYKEKYFELKEHLENNPDFISEATRLNFTSEQFAKKLMGQLAFLYFIQKKGWLGVNAFPKTLTQKQYDKAFYAIGKASREVLPKAFKHVAEDEYQLAVSEVEKLTKDKQETLASAVKGQPWGTGPKNFIRKLFEVCDKKGNNDFFDEYLEPLFYEALNEKRSANDYYYKIKCRVPFLNGGLFEPLDNYDWINNKFDIPNSMFSNRKDKGDYNANGILDIFDRYNFTMNEDEPLEKEVAVDPEMLGKIFENLLDAKDRKSKGAFYTPREIVHYMCQESLVNYLVNETGISYDAIKDFIVYGEFMRDEDTSWKENKSITNLQISTEILDIKNGVKRLEDIDDALANIRVADPAVGSGAFPLGMISEIVKARQNLTAYLALLNENKTQVRMMYKCERHPLTLKLHTIKNSIFAVDIEPSAVDITKLRLWLSLVVDQETDEKATNDGIEAVSKDPQPLPNLDCNIRCGNSLIDELEGIKLVNESELFGKGKDAQIIWGQNQYDNLLKELFDAQDKLFYANIHQNKDALQNKIKAIIDRIIMTSLGEAKDNITEKYNETKTATSLPYFLWQLEFAKVFKEKGGFDVVIGNPPYVDSENMVKNMPELRTKYSKLYKTAKGNWDLYIPFWEKAFNLLNEKGNATFITPNKWLAIKYGEELRKLLFDYIYNISDFSKIKAFESANISTVITFISKVKSQAINVYCFNQKFISNNYSQVNKGKIQPFDNLSLCLSESLNTLEKILSFNVISNNFELNEAATVAETYEIAKYLFDFCDFDKNIEFFKFINTGTIKKYETLWGKKCMTYVKKKYLSPVIKKSDLQINFKRRFEQASAPKIVTTGIRYFECFLDCNGEYLAAKSTVIIRQKKEIALDVILPILNSNLVYYFLKEAYGGLAMGGGVNFTANNLSRIPIPELTIVQQKKLKEYTYNMQNFINSGDCLSKDQFLHEINLYIYSLYGLDNDDKLILETFKKNNQRKK